MKKKLLTLLLSCALLLGCKIKPLAVSHEQVVREYINNVYTPAEALLYQNDEHGLRPICSATAFQRVADGYLFVSAAHCIVLQAEHASFHISPDEENPEKFYEAKVVAYGDMNMDLDFSVLHVTAPAGAFTTVAMGHNPVQAGEALVSVSSPFGLGKLVLRGTVSMPIWNHHEVITEGGFQEDWYHDVLFSLPGFGPGSSGSTILCEDQMKVCAILSGHAMSAGVAQPIEKFEQWWALVQAGKIDPKPALPKPEASPVDALIKAIEGIQGKH